METKKIEEYCANRITRVSDKYNQCLEDAISDLVAIIHEGGERDIIMDEPIWRDLLHEIDYFGLRVREGYIDVVLRTADGTEDDMDLYMMDPYDTLIYLDQFVWTLKYRAKEKEKAEKKQDGQN